MMEPTADFDAWYGATFDWLVASLRLVSGDTDLAVEAASEACARCLKRWKATGPPNHPTAWTYRVGLNLLKRHWWRRQRDGEFVASARAREAAPVDEPALELWAAVARLPPRARTAVALRYLGDLTEADVALAMGIAPGTVAATLSKARATLAQELGPDAREGSHV